MLLIGIDKQVPCKTDHVLCRYYEAQGFVAVGDFVVAGKDDWPGTVLQMSLSS